MQASFSENLSNKMDKYVFSAVRCSEMTVLLQNIC